jgi:hypothetical protein
MTTPSGAATSATAGTVAGRPQPQTTAEPLGGPFVRHAPNGRRAMYTSGQGFGGFMAPPMVSSPGWNKGYRLLNTVTGGVNGTNTVAAYPDAPWNFHQLVQLKDAFGTQLLTGPGYNISYEVPLYGGQFGLDLMRAPQNSPQFLPVSVGSSGTGNWQFSTYLPFEFAKGYGVISGANAALLPVLQINNAASSALYSTAPGTAPTSLTTVDSDFYWLPNVPTDPPGIGTTCQWVFQPCNPTISSGASTVVQLPRLGGYLSVLILELRDAQGYRMSELASATYGQGTGWPSRPKILVDGVPLIDSLFSTLTEDLAISTGIGAYAASTQTVTSGTDTEQGTVPVPRPSGTIAINNKNSLSQRDFGLFDTAETYLSTNPGTQIEIAGYPWGTVTNGPMTLNAIVGQVVPSGNLIQGLPEV